MFILSHPQTTGITGKILIRGEVSVGSQTDRRARLSHAHVPEFPSPDTHGPGLGRYIFQRATHRPPTFIRGGPTN
ncbi:hypothetical protein J6590_032216 [Homalodisca vitripennis]|nr:hypothetical protein J6590_032216 [Homalodisca vitripennis]